MTTLKLVTCDQRLTLVSLPVLASGDKHSVKVCVKLDRYWDGYDIKATFFRDGNRDFVLDVPLENGECMVPPEMLTYPCMLNIGIWGKDVSGKYKTSSVVQYRVVRGAPIEEGVKLVDVRGATATPEMVLKGYTFFSGTPEAKHGTMDIFEEGEYVTINEDEAAGADEASTTSVLGVARLGVMVLGG